MNDMTTVMDGTDALSENTYGNAASKANNQSEPIPVERLQWYNRTNLSLIKRQYEVSTKIDSLLFS